MYEQYFDNFSFVDKDSPFCIVRLNDPFAGVEVLLAKTFTVKENDMIKFDYEVSAIPDEFDKSHLETTDFTDLVKNIFMAILERELMATVGDEQ
jgi:hypothetical protein